LVEFRDVEAEIDYVAPAAESDEKDDPAARFLSKDEWAALSTADRNQLALERYLRSRMAPWQLGRDYERYVGYLREQTGCAVTYHGAGTATLPGRPSRQASLRAATLEAGMSGVRCLWWAVGSSAIVVGGAFAPWAESFGFTVDGVHDEVVGIAGVVAVVAANRSSPRVREGRAGEVDMEERIRRAA
jgi:hypothetical protein